MISGGTCADNRGGGAVVFLQRANLRRRPVLPESAGSTIRSLSTGHRKRLAEPYGYISTGYRRRFVALYPASVPGIGYSARRAVAESDAKLSLAAPCTKL